MRVFAIAGFSGTGKTGLIELLVRELTRRGFSVSTMKSSNEDIADSEGTDTWRHKLAGAEKTIFIGPESVTIRMERPPKLGEFLSSVSSDILLIEGMKEKNIPKIWCIGEGVVPDETPANVIAYYAWEGNQRGEQDSPVYQKEHISELADLVETASVELSKLEI